MTPYPPTNGFLMYYEEDSAYTILAEMPRARQPDILDCGTSEDATSNAKPIPVDFKVSAGVAWKHNSTPHCRYFPKAGLMNSVSVKCWTFVS
jgi:hypothetical protein